MRISAPKTSWSLRFFWRALSLASAPLFASQWGPVFPTHDFPTDRSFLLNSYFDYGSESSVYGGDGKKYNLDGSLTRMRFVANPEYEASRTFMVGAYLNFDSLTLKEPDIQVAKSGLSDQYIYAEYRMLDVKGGSLGVATVVKFPAYSSPSQVEGTSQPFLLLGDGQIDGTLLGTSEYWVLDNIKLYLDAGVTYRTDQFATEIPMQFGTAYVSPRYSFGLAVQGQFSLHNDSQVNSDLTVNVETLTGGTNYVYAANPTLFKFLAWAEYAISYQWAVRGNFENSIAGTNAPNFYNFGIGVSYRYFEPKTRSRTAREVGIDTDDSSDEFEGEIQENQNKSPENFDNGG